MKQILPALFLFSLFFLFPPAVFGVSFAIENPVKEGDYFTVEASLSGISSGSTYVQGMFTATGNPNYFGFTWGQKENWLVYQSSPPKEFIVQNFPVLLKDTLQKIWIKPDFSDSGYHGPGDYLLKLKRYTGASDNSAGDSNSLTVFLDEPAPTVSSTPSQTPPSFTPTSAPSPSLIKTPPPPPVKTSGPSLSPSKTPTAVIPAKAGLDSVTLSPAISPGVLGTAAALPLFASASPTPLPTDSPPTNRPVVYRYTFLFGAILSVISGGWLYFRHQKD